VVYTSRESYTILMGQGFQLTPPFTPPGVLHQSYTCQYTSLNDNRSPKKSPWILGDSGGLEGLLGLLGFRESSTDHREGIGVRLGNHLEF
jgi:hypothetical protein